MTLKNLAYLLSRRLPDYRTALASQIQAEGQLDRLSAPDLFHRLLADPLRIMTIPENAGTQCLVIDGLDECARKEPEKRLEFVRALAEGADRLPTWMRILALSQEIPELGGVLSVAHILRLDGRSTENQADIRQYFENRLGGQFRDHPGWNTALDALVERSGGMFQYALLVSQSILDGQISIENPDEFPHGLAAALDRWFRVYFPNEKEYRDKYRVPMGMFLVSPEPLPVEELRRVNDWNESETEDFLSLISPFLRRETNVFQKETAAFSHSFLSQWLGSDQAGPFRVYPRDARREMARQYYQQFHSEDEELSEYAALHLAEYLEADGNRKKLEEVRGNTDLLVQLGNMGDFCWTWGDTDMALICYERARDMAVYKMKIRGNEQDCWHLMKCCDSIEGILRKTGDIERLRGLKSEFMELYEKAEKQISKHRTNVEIDETGIIEITEPDDENGFQETVFSFEQLVQESGDTVRLHMFWDIYSNMAGSMMSSGKQDQALEVAQKGISVAERLVLQSDKAENQRMLRFSCSQSKHILFRLGMLKQAMEQSQKGLIIAEQLAEKPGIMVDRINLSRSLEDVGGIIWATGNPVKALDLYHCARLKIEQIPQKSLPSDCQDILARLYNAIGVVTQELDRPEEAFVWSQKAYHKRKFLVQKRKTLDDYDSLANIHLDIGYYYLLVGNLDTALDHYQKALSLAERVAQKRGTPDDQRNISLGHYRIAEAMEQTCDSLVEQSCNPLEEKESIEAAIETALSGAQKHFETALSGLAKVVQDRNSPEDQIDSAACRHKLADLRWNTGELDASRNTYAGVRDIYENVAHLRDTPSDWQYICVSDNNLAAVLEETGDLDGALDAYRRDLSTAEMLVSRWNAPMDQESLAVSCWNIALFPHAPMDERLSCARRGLGLAQALLDGVGEQIAEMYKPLYQELVDDFKTLLEELEAID